MHGGGEFDLLAGLLLILAPGFVGGILVSLYRRRGGLATIAVATLLTTIALYVFAAALLGLAADEGEARIFLAAALFVPSLVGAILGTGVGAVLADRLASRRTNRPED